MTTTARLDLPLIEPGQAQKELFHNEALTRLDAAVQASVAGIGLDTPPAERVYGTSWIVGPAPVGEWAGQAAALATWTPGGWRFVAAREGLGVWDLQAALPARFVRGDWETGVVRAGRVAIAGRQVLGPQEPAIAEPRTGATVDAEARTAIAAILTALRRHGLIEG